MLTTSSRGTRPAHGAPFARRIPLAQLTETQLFRFSPSGLTWVYRGGQRYGWTAGGTHVFRREHTHVWVLR